jgi:ethanolamine utilization protein EutA
MLSVGIDIGTTTTQLVFSDLTLAPAARAGQVPRLAITGRSLRYASPILATPLLDAETLDAPGLGALLRAEYARAGITPGQVETGAVIITGETARARNAEQVLRSVAGLAGDFVVTVAGPHVEGLMAGRGSGAARWSREHFGTVINVDMGGGSANSAVFRLGEARGSAAMAFGGRSLELDGDRVRAVTGPGRIILEAAGLHLAPGDRPGLAELRRMTDAMAELTFQLVEGASSPLAERLYLTPPALRAWSPDDAGLLFSGGVGFYVHQPIPLDSVPAVARHGDLGPLLADSVRNHPGLARRPRLAPRETQRATVLGAGTQTLALSGATLWVDPGLLPLKNLPVLRPGGEQGDGAGLAAALEALLQRWDLAGGGDFALALELEPTLDFPRLRELAAALAAFAERLPPAAPLIVLLQPDYAQALGLLLKGLAGARPLLILDQVRLEEGDYLDLGAPLMDGRVVPLVVKTLVFYDCFN